MAKSRCIHLLLALLTVVCSQTANSAFAQEVSTNSILDHKLLVLTSLKHPDKRFALDSTGLLNIVCMTTSDSLVASRYRQLSGKLIHFTDSSFVLHVEEETISSYWRDGTSSQFYYSIALDSTRLHLDTLLFSDVHTLRFDKGRTRLLIHFLQSSTYTFAIGNMLVLVTSLILPNKYPNLVGGQNALIVTSTALALGGSSFLFYPKLYRINPQINKKRQRISWKLEVI